MPSPEPRVWVAGPGEADAVAALLAEFRDWWGRSEPGDESLRASVGRLIEAEDTDYLLGRGGPGSAPGGVCQLRYHYGVWRAADDCLLEDLFVRERDRRAGLGGALVAGALERARSRGCRRVLLDVNEANPAAVALYERHGFSSWFDPPGGRNLNMRRDL